MKHLFLLILGYYIIVAPSAIAQSAEITNVLNLKSKRQTGTIKEQNTIVGYYTFYFKEKQDRENSVYEIAIMDNDLNSVNSFEFKRSQKTRLMESVYNGSVFMFFFYDPKAGYEFVTYDLNGNEQGSTKIPKSEIPAFDMSLTNSAHSTQTDNATIFPAGTDGFIRQSYIKGKKQGYEIISFSNEATIEWRYSVSENSEMIENAEIGEVTEDLVTATISKRKSMMTKKMDLTFLILNRKTGKKLAELDMGSAEEGKKSVLNSYVDKTLGKIVLIGEYYKPGDDILKDFSEGLFFQEVGMDGKLMSEKRYAWQLEIADFKQSNLSDDDKDADKPFSIYFHDVIRSGNGHLFLIGEQYKKQASAMGIANIAMGSSDQSAVEIRIGSMVVIELDENNRLVDYDIIRKKNSSVALPGGMGMYSTAFLGYYVRSIGGFDYNFTSRNPEADEFTVVYLDLNRKEDKDSKKSDVMVGTIHISEGEKKADRISINSDARSMWLQAAKPGHILVAEYYKKERLIKYRMEQLTY